MVKQGIEAYLYLTQTRLALRREDATSLKQAYYTSLGHAALLEAQLHQVLPLVQDVEHAVLKGVALAYTLYPEPAAREMSDIDLLVPFETWNLLVERFHTRGYRVVPSPATPPAFTRMFGGELKLAPPGQHLFPVELHWPLARGEWVRLTTEIDFAAVWARRQQVEVAGFPVSILAFEDMLLYAAIHFAVNHRLGHFGVRALLDLHVLAQYPHLNWDQIVRDARAWRIQTVVWLVLGLTKHVFDSPVPQDVLTQLQPGKARRSLLQLLHPEHAVLSPADARPFRRFLLLYLLVDRPQDVVRFLRHTFWPDKHWAMARYEAETWRGIWKARLKHFWDLATNAERL
ncbi:nucleotidyltransferase family protein [Ardenticatena maritima]|nr:nucleotidyltransferase family protein [Ardenticatena maritima]KPL88273.1 hypothetical protein SE16_05385 [Ardenticatena maritima]